MEALTPLLITTDAALMRTTVAALSPEGVFVSASGREAQACDVLDMGETSSLAEGDIVFVWFPFNPPERGIVLGRVHVAPVPRAKSEDLAARVDELVIEAESQLTLKCGDGSITIREDGKILIKGKDL